MLGIGNTVAWLTPHAAVARENGGPIGGTWMSRAAYLSVSMVTK
jgi:hypothetical protein